MCGSGLRTLDPALHGPDRNSMSTWQVQGQKVERSWLPCVMHEQRHQALLKVLVSDIAGFAGWQQARHDGQGDYFAFHGRATWIQHVSKAIMQGKSMYCWACVLPLTRADWAGTFHNGSAGICPVDHGQGELDAPPLPAVLLVLPGSIEEDAERLGPVLPSRKDEQVPAQ